MILGDRPGEVWGSDLDATALAVARRGVYASATVVELPEALRSQWLEPGGGATVRARDELRARVRFVRDDLTAERVAPGPPFHLVCCRNVLIYLTPTVQQRVLERLVHSLVPGGLLCLGEAEWISRPLAELTVVDRTLRLFRRVPAALAS
jgi:two-component system CheB/CheR fusion protein